MDEPIQVFEYETYDTVRNRWRRSGQRGTAAAIKKAGYVAIASTVMVVDASRLDENGFLVTSRPLPS